MANTQDTFEQAVIVDYSDPWLVKKLDGLRPRYSEAESPTSTLYWQALMIGARIRWEGRQAPWRAAWRAHMNQVSQGLVPRLLMPHEMGAPHYGWTDSVAKTTTKKVQKHLRDMVRSAVLRFDGYAERVVRCGRGKRPYSGYHRDLNTLIWEREEIQCLLRALPFVDTEVCREVDGRTWITVQVYRPKHRAKLTADTLELLGRGGTPNEWWLDPDQNRVIDGYWYWQRESIVDLIGRLGR